MARILVLEDDRDLSDQWDDTLTLAGHEVTITRNASEATIRVNENVYDLVIVDMYIREGGKLIPDGGVILLSRLRQLIDVNRPIWWRTVPILAVSGGASIKGGFDPLRTARDLQATDWMRKPFTPQDLNHRVTQLLNDHAQAAE